MIRDFTIEYRKNPLGIDEIPRFSWKLSSRHKEVLQKQYQIQVIHAGKMVWDSGIVESDQSILIPYCGDALEPLTKYRVQVRVCDNYGEIGQESGCFETGLIDQGNWKAAWITHLLPETETACPVFVRNFSIDPTIKSARLYMTACGVYEALINGKRVGDSYMSPGWTSYHNRIQYQTYDVTELLERQNEIAVTVGNGWYKGLLGFEEKPNNYGSQAALLAMIRVEYPDGRTEIWGTDTEWTVETRTIRSSEIYHGEIQDLRQAPMEWGNAVLLDPAAIPASVVAQESVPVRITERIEVKEKIITPKGEIVFDFGQNLAGVVEVNLPKLSGEQLIIRHAESLDKEGNFYTENLRTAKCTDTYLYDSSQTGLVVAPHFTFHGFRYICVEGVTEEVSSDCFTACALHTDMTLNGKFHTDNPLVNQLQSNIGWGLRGNFLDIPTDCPQRNERLGWTGDAQVFCGTASFHYHTALFFRKWLRDMAAETTEEWGVPHVVPNILGNQAGAAAWSDAATIIPWKMYQIYGDKQILAECFPMMKTWVNYMQEHSSENGLWQTGFQYGDWLALDIEAGSTDRTGGTDKYLVANAFYAYSTRIVRDSAQILGLEEDERKYARLYDALIEAINNEFITSTGRLVSETQTACVLMLYFHLAKPEYREKIAKTLELNIGAHHNHLTTGFVGTPYLCHCLSEQGAHELANEIFMKEDFPGWFYAVKKGATTIWERWNSILPNGDFDESGMNSLNHYAYGSIGSWLYEKVTGIYPLEPGYKKVGIRPVLTRGMTEAAAEYECAYGTIKCGWSCRNGMIHVDISIPENTSAIVRLPEKTEELSLGSGEYHYEYETQTNLEIEKFSMDSTLGELVAEELGRKMFEELVPGMLDNPMIKFAYDMTLSDLTSMDATAGELYQTVIRALNSEHRESIKKQ